MKYLIIGLLVIVLVQSCDNSKNDDIAKIIKNENDYSIKLTGKRNLASHDLIDLFQSKTYSDSTFILIPIREGVITANRILFEGKNLPYYGQIHISKRSLMIDIKINDSSSGKVRNYSWNGNYQLLEVLK